MAPVPEFMAISWRIGPLTTTIAAIELVVLPRALTPLAASARITGKYSGRAPAITALTATCSTVNSQCWRNWFERRWPATSSGLWLVCASISATRFSVGRTMGSLSVQLFSKNTRCKLSSVSASTNLGVETLKLDFFKAIPLGGPGEPFDDFLHHRPAADRALAIDIGAQLFRGLAHHRLGHESVTRLGHAVHAGHRLHRLFEGVGVDSDGGHTVFAIESDCVHGDRRRASASMADTDDGAVAVGLDHFPGFGIVLGVDARHFDELGLNRGHVLDEPILHLAQEKS